MFESADLFIFWIVVLARLLVPLSIPKFPLIGVILALLLDAVDQTIFQIFTNLPLDGYQSYDKSLDIYYLTICYISTLRNWTHLFAFKSSMFLFYYRMIGVILFEITQIRTILLIFPNTFEYFFIFYEAVNTKWNPKRLSKKAIVLSIAFIWIFIKLPQEYWIHVAQLDTTDLIKEKIFHVSTDTPFSEIITMYPWFFVILIILIIGLVFLLRYIMKNKLPKADWPVTFNSDSKLRKTPEVKIAVNSKTKIKDVLNRELIEKMALLSSLTLIFGNVLPGIQAPLWQLCIAVSVIIFANTIISELISRRNGGWQNLAGEFIAMLVINFGLILLYNYLKSGSFILEHTLFAVLLISLIVTLYDRYRPIFTSRFR